jgi:UDP-2,3-diacylglucosamine pyrophosphatase LpxH
VVFRKLQVSIISDVHLGTYGCHASELIQYLKSINPEILVLNGDIIDGWAFSKRYFPAVHMQVIKEITSLISKGTKVYYITGNHDEMLRRYSGFELGNFHLDDKLVLDIDGKKAWIFHGDVFDASTKGAAKWLAKLGGKGYDILILLNSFINFILKVLGKEKMSFSKKVKSSVKKAVAWIGDFELCAAELGAEKGYDFVICGHIHQPQDRVIETQFGKIRYLNSGDWIENLTALEYNDGVWNIHQYAEAKAAHHAVYSLTKKHPQPDVLNNPIELVVQSISK